MAKAIRIDDPAQARAILQRYAGNAEAQAALADLDAQDQQPQPTPSAARLPARARRKPAAEEDLGTDEGRNRYYRRLQADEKRRARLRAQVQQYGAIPGDYKTLLLQRQLQQQQQQREAAEEREAAIDRGRKAALRQRQEQEAAREADRSRLRDVQRRVGGFFDRIRGVTDRLNQRADRIPTPGGLASLFLALLLLTFAAVPVNASADGSTHSRLELLWLVIRGQATLPNGANSQAAKPAVNTSGVQSAPGTGGLSAQLRARTAPVAVTQDAQTIARLPIAPGPGILAGPWTFPTRGMGSGTEG